MVGGAESITSKHEVLLLATCWEHIRGKKTKLAWLVTWMAMVWAIWR